MKNITETPEINSIGGKNPEEAMNILLQREQNTLNESENFQIEWCIRVNELTWNNQEAACDFINNSFPDLDTLQLLV
jgi:hypothetical protein